MPDTLVTYLVEKIGVHKPGPKAQARNEDRVFTVTGTFYRTSTDAKGNLVKGEKLSIPSKNIDREDMLTEGFTLDKSNGILTLPEGKRGRAKSADVSEDDIAETLAALRAAAAETSTQ